MESLDAQIRLSQQRLTHLQETRKQVVQEIRALIAVRDMLEASIQKHVGVYKEVSGNLQAALDDLPK